MYSIEMRIVGSYQANCYALTNEAGTIVIDPGAQPEVLVEWLADKNVVGIVATHCHCDHIGAVNELVDATGAWVACGRDDVEGMADTHRSGFDEEGTDYTVTHCERVLEEGDTLTWGEDSLRVIHTPGHTPGSICLIDDTHQLMFSGDLLFAGAIGSTAFVLGNEADMMASCHRLTQMPGELTVFPGHGRSTRLGIEQPMLHSIVEFYRRSHAANDHMNSNWREGV